jgi:hypothetical protein
VKEEEDAVSNLNASCFASINNFVEFFKTGGRSGFGRRGRSCSFGWHLKKFAICMT